MTLVKYDKCVVGLFDMKIINIIKVVALSLLVILMLSVVVGKKKVNT